MLVISTFIAQFIMIDSAYNQKASKTLRLEGSKVISNQNIKSVGFIDSRKNTLEIMIITPYIPSLPKVNLFQNGELVNDFTYPNVKLKVKPGDKITIDNTSYDLNIKFELLASADLKLKNNTINVQKGMQKTIRVY
ncbi:hypothetical protein [Desulfonispora thiosulfatigenes]|uniref:hypothetical protein n=1 Tax=Desulfonispora thiosulfatigenes TaxID=83661 RepID=UPI001A9A4788|nr:hypothetical protein [Desulfonispora thiosulfatigenes]